MYTLPIKWWWYKWYRNKKWIISRFKRTEKRLLQEKSYGKFNATIFKMITDKLNEDLEVKKEWIYDSLNEISLMRTDGTDVDDGPNIVYPSAQLFNKMSIERAHKLDLML